MGANEVEKHRSTRSPGLQPPKLGFRLLLLASLALVAVLAWASIGLRAGSQSPRDEPTPNALVTAFTSTSSPTAFLPPSTPSLTSTLAPTQPAILGSIAYAARVAGRVHLWAYVPGDGQPTQVTSGDWDDRDPAFSPDGNWLAFSSRRDGNWDLYLLRLATFELIRLTDTPGYEGRPTWSPDGRWLAYEAYDQGNLDIRILPVDGSQPPIQLTSQVGADLSPSWDPNGRRIAFVSDRDGSKDIFVADLDNPDQRFHNLTNTPDTQEYDPAFSPDGDKLVYSARQDGIDSIFVLDLADSRLPPVRTGQGCRPAWSPDGLSVAAVLATANDAYLLSYPVGGQGPLPLDLSTAGRIESLTWTRGGLPGEVYSRAQSLATPEPLFIRREATAQSGPGRYQLVRLQDLPSPNNLISDAVDEAFIALRGRTSEELGWDFLSSLEHAFVGLNDPLPPGFQYNDWLYTGRAFAFNQVVFQAGWVEVVREDLAGQTFWRVFVRVSPQDGTRGEPLRERPWDFAARFGGDPSAYDQGGDLRTAVPAGYYLDFTTLASDYGFERLPAFSNWRTFYPAARFNEFAMTEGISWTIAMLELYPPEAIVTPTPFRTPTQTPTITPSPTPTPWWWRWRTPTPSRTPLPPASPTPTP